MNSIWTKDVTLPEFPALNAHLRADAVIIGGGLTGLLTANALRRAGLETVILEADRIGGGQSGKTTAKLTAQHALHYQKLEKTLGLETAQRYARSQLAAVERLRRLVWEWGMDCDFTDCTTFLYTTGAPAALETEYALCRRLGMDVFLTTDTELPFAATALGLRKQACFHPLKLLRALSDGLTIYEHSRVLRVRGHTVSTARGSVTAGKLIFACHFPFLNVPGFFFLRQHQERSYVLALEGAAPMNDCYLGVEEDGLSFRPYGRCLLLGGGGHRTGENRSGARYAALEQAARRFWPRANIAARWSAQDCMPMDGLPCIGRFSAAHPDYLAATGFRKWGMSNAVLAAEILSDLAAGRDTSPDCAIFSPQRFHLRASAKQLSEDALCSAKGLTRRLLAPGRIPVEDLPAGRGGVVTMDGKKVGAYRSEDGLLHIVSLKCPHLGCQLEWNPDEKTWDCPCHGSRFDVDGHLLDGPAQSDLRAHRHPHGQDVE
ncbi:MAG: FAD-dependent oxidoreductase [Ruminococcaceae bacterium]|nr:FAD-dependent oxidoreductase [Oscillospiraceae bacterium]